jgi:hypothetical protein
MTETTSAELRTAAWLLLIGGIVFLVGAFSPPSEQWTSPLKRSLQVIGEHRAGWYWIHACFVVGVVLTMLGFVAFAGARNRHGSGSTLTDVVTALYVVGAGFWLVSIAFRVTVQVWAANEVVATGAIPAPYEPWHQFLECAVHAVHDHGVPRLRWNWLGIASRGDDREVGRAGLPSHSVFLLARSSDATFR